VAKRLDGIVPTATGSGATRDLLPRIDRPPRRPALPGRGPREV